MPIWRKKAHKSVWKGEAPSKDIWKVIRRLSHSHRPIRFLLVEPVGKSERLLIGSFLLLSPLNPDHSYRLFLHQRTPTGLVIFQPAESDQTGVFQDGSASIKI